MTTISSYSDLLDAAKAQSEPQRMLFVFASAGLPESSTEGQKNRHSAGEGGTLSPVMCVDKLPAELGSFSSLVEESRQTGLIWDIAFVSSMSGRAGIAPGSDEVEQPLKMMVDAIQNGRFGNLLAFNRDGELVRFF